MAAWRERRAAETDQPVRHVLSDLAIVGIASNPPKTIEQLRRVRGLDERNARGHLGEELLAAVERGRSGPTNLVRRAARRSTATSARRWRSCRRG